MSQQTLTSDVLKYFEEHKGPHTTSEIASALNLKDRNTLRALLNYLKTKGTMTSDGRGLWMTTEDDAEDSKLVEDSKYQDLKNAVGAILSIYEPVIKRGFESHAHYNTPANKKIAGLYRSLDNLIYRLQEGYL